MAEIYKQIKDFTLKNSIDGTEDILIQSNGITMRVKSSQLKTSVDLSNYYTKSEVDNLLANLNVEVDMADYYDKASIDNLLLQKANASHTHTSADITDLSIPTVDVDKAYVDSQLANKSNTNHTHDEYISETELNEKGYATETYVQTKIAEVATGGTVDLSNYATKTELTTELNKKANLSHTHNAEDINGLNIPTKLSELQNDSGFISEIPSEYINETELNNALANKANTSDIPSLAGYATKNDLNTKADKSEIPSLEGYATETYVTNKIAEASLSGGEVDLSGLATKDELATKADKTYVDNQLATKSDTDHTHSYNDLTDKPTIPSTTNLATKTELTNGLATKADKVHTHDQYLTEHQDISNLALKSELHSHTNKTVLDGITSTKVNEWNNKSNFDGDYNSLTNKPIIPTVPTKTSQLTNDSGFITSVPSEYITESELNSSLSTKANTSDIPSLTGYATETYVMNKLGGKSLIYLTQSEYDLLSDEEKQDSTKVYNITDAVIDYNELANTPTIPTKTSELNNDSDFTTKTYVDERIAELLARIEALENGSAVATQYGYELTNISNNWSFYKNDDSSTTVNIPHTYNVDDIQNGGGYYRGIAYYEKTISIDDISNKYYLIFNAVNASSEIYVNDQLTETHDGGYTPFVVDISDKLQNGNNAIKVKVDNSFSYDIAPQCADFNFCGGITRNVYLATGTNVYFDTKHYGTRRTHLTQLNVSSTSAQLKIQTMVINQTSTSLNVTVNYKIKDGITDIASDSVQQTITNGYSDLENILTVSNPILWQGLSNPKLYTVEISIVKNGKTIDRISEKVGFRTFEATTSGFNLNGTLYPLRGVNRHAENSTHSFAMTTDDHDADFEIIKELNANAIRLAHYPQDHYVLDKCDELGIIVYMEIPWVNVFATDATEAYKENIRSQLKEMINDYYNHTSIAFWGLNNELGNSDSNNGESTVYDENGAAALNNELYDYVKTTDTTRLCGFVTNNESNTDTFTSDYFALNTYPGWYSGKADSINYSSYNTKKFIISEYGAGANVEQHVEDVSTWGTGDMKASGSLHPEEYQAYVHECHVNAIKPNNWICGSFIWALFDFAQDFRNEGGQVGLNDKGLVTRDRTIKKDAYYLYKSWWNPEPMVHICSKRFTNRTSNNFKIKAYSNCESATLYVNDAEIQTISNPKNGIIFEFDTFTATTETNNVKVIAVKDTLEYTDECIINVTISSGGGGEVSNNELVCSLSYDNITGTTLNDASGKNNTGTLTNSASVSENYLQISSNAIKVNNLSINDDASFMMEIKVNLNSSTAALSRILQSDNEAIVLFADGTSTTSRRVVFKCANVSATELHIESGLIFPKDVKCVIGYDNTTKTLKYNINGTTAYNKVISNTIGSITNIYLCNRADAGRPMTGGFYEFKAYNYYDESIFNSLSSK